MKTLIGLIVLAAIAGVFYLAHHPNQKSRAQKFGDCTASAGRRFDQERQTIAEKNYGAVEQANFYRDASSSYTKALDSCRQLYSQ